MAHVRVAGPHEAARSPAPPATAVATGREPSRQPAAALASGSSAVVKPFRTEVTALVQADEPIHRSTPRPPLPQGISTLGGPTGETGDPAAIAPQPTQGRTVWWRLPPPEWTPVQEWTPFKDGASNY
jgi:hypothetical protein